MYEAALVVSGWAGALGLLQALKWARPSPSASLIGCVYAERASETRHTEAARCHANS
jgi:hypothetical protein